MIVPKIMRAFGEGIDDAALNRARYIAVSKQIPVMYSIIGVSLIAAAYTHHGVAPDYLTVYLPAAFVLMVFYRAALLWRSDIAKLSDEEIADKMVTAIKRSTVMALMFAGWELALFQYGTAYTQLHVAFFATITVLSCIACMMHLRLSSTLLALLINGPSVVFLALSDITVFNAIAINALLVTGTMLFMCFRYANDFKDLIAKQQQLQEQRSRLRSLNRQNRWLADHDSLTDLPNRRHFFSRLAESIGGDHGETRPRIVGILDLDGFKAVNDVLGHLAGDQLLADTANRLRDVLGDDAFLSRLGGDEFGLIFGSSIDAAGAVAKSNQLCEALLAAFDVKGSSVHIAATVGLASYPSAGRTGEEVYERADYALCYAKQHSKGTVVLFSEEHETIIREVSQITHQLREAELDEELSVVYQPIIDSGAGRLTAFEALARWDSPVLGRISPDTFIRTAEQAGLIGQLTTILFRKALAVAERWPEDVGLSFNLSPYDLNSFETMARLIQAVEESKVRPSRITFEITESALVQDIGRATESLEVLRNMGSSIALDDFGTGFSSLGQIQRMPVDRIKIDRSFITGIETDGAARNIVNTIIDLCRNLNLECVVEGVETREQLELLEARGCSLIQGYYFSKPLPPEEADMFLGKWVEKRKRNAG
ncbi:MAG: EAL domain-containing protein [Rhodobiaceae bacterium]|nr:EAL domain-containing protein [Rhodobiaceae bacterium]MCC0056347.1 EAL domain-containing protein [Rhodobiaceae bacterium]